MDTLLLPEQEVRGLVSMEEAIKAVEKTFKEKGFVEAEFSEIGL